MYESVVQWFIPLVQIQPQPCEYENAWYSLGALQLSQSSLLLARLPEHKSYNIIITMQSNRAPDVMVHVLPSGLGPPQTVAVYWKKGKAESADAIGLQLPWGQLCIHLHVRTYTIPYSIAFMTKQLPCCCLIHGLMQQCIVLHMLSQWWSSCTTITCSSSKSFAQSVVYDIHSALHSQVLFCSPTNTWDMQVVHTYTEGIPSMHSSGVTASDKPSCLPQDASSMTLVYQSDCIILLSQITHFPNVRNVRIQENSLYYHAITTLTSKEHRIRYVRISHIRPI